MLISAIIALFLFFVYSGIGLLFTSKFETQYPSQLPRNYWLGWAAGLGFLQIWHFFSPVGSLSGLLLSAAGLVGWWKHRHSVTAWFKKVSAWKTILTALIILVCAVFISNQVITGKVHYDHGLYHLQTVKWLQSYALVPGLGNLHHRLAFNNASLLFTAQLNSGLLDGYAFSLNNTLLGLAVAISCLASLPALVHKSAPSKFADMFHIIFLPLLFFYTRAVAFAGYSPDVAVFVLQYALASELLHLADQPDNSGKALMPVFILAAASVCVKLSSAVFSASIMLAAICIQAHAENLKLTVFIKKYLPRSAAVIMAFILPWLARGAVLSGYLLFPLSTFPLPVMWRMPLSMVQPVAEIITLWARFGRLTPLASSFQEFLPLWVSRNPIVYTRTVMYSLILFAIALLIFKIKKVRPQNLSWVWLAICASAGLVYWFIAAPDPRFAGAAFWLLLSAALMAAISAGSTVFPRISSKMFALAVCISLFVWLWPPVTHSTPAERILFPLDEHSFAGAQVRPENTPYLKTNSGLKVYIANDAARQSCWDAPLPCTSENDFEPGLKLVRADDLQSGFYYDFNQ